MPHSSGSLADTQANSSAFYHIGCVGCNRTYGERHARTMSKRHHATFGVCAKHLCDLDLQPLTYMSPGTFNV